MWSRKQSICSALSGASKGDEGEALAGGLQIYPFAIALRVRVLQIVCGIGGIVVGAVGWLEERQKVELGLGVPAGAVTVLAAATSVYYSRGFGGWPSARTGAPRAWGAPWRALGPSPCAAVPLTLLWATAIAAHIAMLAFCIRSLLNIGCGSSTCLGVAGAQLSVSVSTLAATAFMLQLDLRYDATVSPPPRQSDLHTCTAVSMIARVNKGNLYRSSRYRRTVSKKSEYHRKFKHKLRTSSHTPSPIIYVPLTSVAANSGNSDGSPHEKAKDASLPPEPT